MNTDALVDLFEEETYEEFIERVIKGLCSFAMVDRKLVEFQVQCAHNTLENTLQRIEVQGERAGRPENEALGS